MGPDQIAVISRVFTFHFEMIGAVWPYIIVEQNYKFHSAAWLKGKGKMGARMDDHCTVSAKYLYWTCKILVNVKCSVESKCKCRKVDTSVWYHHLSPDRQTLSKRKAFLITSNFSLYYVKREVGLIHVAKDMYLSPYPHDFWAGDIYCMIVGGVANLFWEWTGIFIGIHLIS